MIGRFLKYDEYDSHDAIRFSRLKQMGRSPMHYKVWSADARDTPTLRFGRLVHRRLLQPDLDGAHVIIPSTLNLATKAGRKERDELTAGVDPEYIVREGDWSESTLLADRLRERIGHWLERPHLAEQGVAWTTHDRPAKGRLDLLVLDECLVDVKTARSIEPRTFGRAVAQYSYHAQLAWYQAGVKAATGRWLPVYLACIETQWPYDVGVYEVTEVQLQAGWDLCEAWLTQLRDCERSGSWPGACPEVTDLMMPAWSVMEPDSELVIGGEKVPL